MGIFKAYDIRGIVPEELDAEKAYRIGKAIATYLNGRTIAVGRDNRISSDEMFAALSKGIMEMGADVIDMGVVSTPMAYFGVNHLSANGLVMITASHNPKQYNGFKVTRENAIPVSGDSGIGDIEQIYENNAFKAAAEGSMSKVDITDAYLAHLSKFVKNIAGLKVVVDTGNGVMGPLVQDFFSHLFIEFIPLNFERDGNYPRHEPNPMAPENLRELKIKVREMGANMGISFDGDGDRVVFVDEKGEAVSSDFVTALIAETIMKPGDIVLYDLRSSRAVREAIIAHRGKAEMCRVGHSLIKEHMRRVNALFAGELSGHYYFRDNFFADSGFIAALLIMGLVSQKGKLSELVKPLKKYYKIPEKNFEVEDKDAALERIEKKYCNGKILKMDGISVETDDFWLNVRKSNTEPIVRLNLEAKSKSIMEKTLKEIEGLITGNTLPQSL